MLGSLLATITLAAAAVFDHFEIPIKTSNPHVLWVNSGYDSARDLMVLDGVNFLLYENVRETGFIHIELPMDCAAVDLADLNGDGRADLIAVAGRRILLYNLAKDAPPETEILFEADTIYASRSGAPFPQVLVVKKDENAQPALALPNADELLVYNINGDILERYPIGSDAPHHAAFGQPFQGTPLLQNRAAPKSALELTIQQTVAVKPDLPRDWLPTELPIPLQRRATARQLLDVATAAPELWPWFPLEQKPPEPAAARTPLPRVRYAIEQKEDPRTLVRLERPAPPGQNARFSPVKRFPGRIVQPEENAPDFNGDGYADLLTWVTPTPAPSLNTMTRMLGGGTWPLYLQARLFNPETGQYGAEADTTIPLEVTLEMLLRLGANEPMRNVVLADVNADGDCDISFSLQESHFHTWLFSPEGFPQKPQGTVTLQEPIERVRLHGVINPDTGRYAIILQTTRALHALRRADNVK